MRVEEINESESQYSTSPQPIGDAPPPAEDVKHIPHRSFLEGGLLKGQTAIIKAISTIDGQRFSVNLQSGEHEGCEIPLHISVRFDENKVVFNTFNHGEWGKEEREFLPIRKGDNFDLRIKAEDNYYQIFFNREKFHRYEFRLPANQATVVSLEGDVVVHSVTTSFYA
uniref:Galectin n=1 Tax=Acrobeloides nanus TaxID=290746 RepID=A0A914C2P5_9BILA